ncbi:uncharacterized protein LOC110731386 [Chenopodium quinoa]|uniref:uncharacterized protein LOC110731386 n=1 Tax=Chenopodium quinoa TaxID=63459 RepID=UPI000B79680E|nr:uncharacterized protein LOC110731386 [Chenopodium quinoa]
MDHPPTSFSGRRRSSVIDPNAPLPITSSASPTPRRSSAWGTTPTQSIAPMASDISSRRASEATEASSNTASGYPDAANIAGRKASAWDDEDSTASMSGTTRGSVSDIAGRRATALDRPPWDVFSGVPPGNEGSTWGWMSEIFAMTSSTGIPLSGVGPTSERIPVYYTGNINYIFETHNEQSLAIANVEAIMYAYGIDKACAKDILSKIDPRKSGIFNVNSQTKQILVASTINFTLPKEPLGNLRQASKCFRENLLSPLHFAAYIFDVLKGRYIGNDPQFMILGIYSIFGVLEGSTKRELTTKDVEKFTRLWKVNNSEEVQDLMNMIKDDRNGSISCWDFYNLLCRRNMFGKQRIEMFDTQGQQNTSMFFPLMDKDEDGFLSSMDLRSFAAIFGRYPSDEAIDRVIRKLDIDGDGKISLQDFRGTMGPILDGMAWEFWLVAILLTFQL